MRLPQFLALPRPAFPKQEQYIQFKICIKPWELKQQDRRGSINLFGNMSSSIFLSLSISLIFFIVYFPDFLFYSVYPLLYNTSASLDVVETSHGTSANMCGVHIAWERRSVYTAGSRDRMMSGFSGHGPKGVSSDSVPTATKTSNVKYAN